MRATLTPLVSQLGADIALLLGGAIVIEQVYGLQGVGALAVQAVNNQDRPIIIGVVLLGGILHRRRQHRRRYRLRAARSARPLNFPGASNADRRIHHPRMHVRDHLVPVPLDWSRPGDGPVIEVFVREVVDPARRKDELPLLVFLQGGPGGKSPRPAPGSPPWLVEALKTHRVLLPDQRGTGRSTRIESATMAQFADGEAAADYLVLFRADSIVADLEHVRKTLFGGKQWESLGQSYGGFLTLTYLSQGARGARRLLRGGRPRQPQAVGRRGLSSDLSARRRQDGALLQALPRRCRPRRRPRRLHRRQRRAPARRRPADGEAAADGRHRSRHGAGPRERPLADRRGILVARAGFPTISSPP